LVIQCPQPIQAGHYCKMICIQGREQVHHVHSAGAQRMTVSNQAYCTWSPFHIRYRLIFEAVSPPPPTEGTGVFPELQVLAPTTDSQLGTGKNSEGLEFGEHFAFALGEF
jgi:hypothetical protein